MRIKWIELNGFKSFPERTKIELNEGITCFVGPNGAGKSNIVDAFRWILGEHNPRILRGEKMEEVIFQGSTSKKEKGLAEVSILLNIKEESQNGKIPQNREIEIKRKFYRTGESFFIINGKQSRLKYIKEIFLSEGIDLRTYSIIDQLKINEILFRTSHRKALLEECAGISLYKMKKTESETKLTSAKENLQRIEDILGELKKQYSLLERQAKRAEKYKKILTEMTDLELKVSKTESNLLLDKLEKLKKEIKSIEQDQQILKEKNTAITNKIGEQKIKITAIDNQIQILEKENKQKEFEKAKTEKELALLSQEENNKTEVIEKLHEEISLLSNEIEKLQREIKESEIIAQDIEEKLKTLQEQIILYEENLLEFQKNIGEIENAIENERKSLFNLNTELASKKNFYNSLKKSLEINQNRLNSLTYKKQEIRQKIRHIERDCEEKKIKIKKFHESLQKERAELKELINKISILDKSFDDKSHKLIEKRKQEAVISGKIEALSSEIWTEDKENKLFFECIDVSPEGEDLIEIFFDEKLKASVIDDIDQITFSENRKFFFLKNISNYNQKTTFSCEIKSIKEYINIKENGINIDIIENVFIVENLKEALEQQRKIPNSVFITKKGEVLYPDGFIKTGKNTDLLKKKRTLEELRNQKELINIEIESLEKEQAMIKTEKEQIKENIELKKKLINTINNDLFRLEEENKNLHKEIEGVKQRLKFMDNEEKTIEQEIEENKRTVETIKREIEHLSFQIQDIETKIEGLKKKQANTFKEIEIKKDTLSTKKIELSTFKERLNSKNAEIRKLNDNIKSLLTKKNKNELEIEQNLRKISQIKIEYSEKINKLEILNKEIENLKNEVEKLFNLLQEEKGIINQLESEYHHFNEELQNITVLLGDKKAKESELKIKLENLWNEIYNLYGKDIFKEQIEPPEDYDLAKGKIIQLKEQLKDLGSVDVEILGEYKEVKERYDFMLNQQRDIKTSIEELEEAIKKINILTRKKLRETFELIREKFNLLFQELFGGGKAEVFLTDESNILDSELEIKVQPPGKKMSSINLLSGGEKTLTAIAFIFACLSVRPSPICILDEVDAPLDDSNTLRFRNLIKTLTDKTQFIIITHNKLMMESANYIYGVTMQEEGVSTVISLELKEAEDYV